MKLDPKKIINPQPQREPIQITSSQETNNSNYKTNKKKLLTKGKGQTSGSTQCTDSSSYKRSAKVSKSKDLSKKIIFDDYLPSQNSDLIKAPMDTYSQETNQQSQLRMIDTQSQNFGYCHSQLDDYQQNMIAKQISDDAEFEENFDGNQLNQYNENSNNNNIFPQTSFETVHLQQHHNNFMRSNSIIESIQDQPYGLNRFQSKEMIPEYAPNSINNNSNIRMQSDSFFSMSSRNRNTNLNSFMSREEIQYNNENEMKPQYQPLNIHKPAERKLLGDITYQIKPTIQSPQLDEECYNNNNNQNIDQEEINMKQNVTQNQNMENDQFSSLFHPRDENNFIEDQDSFEYDNSFEQYPQNFQNSQFSNMQFNQNSQSIQLYQLQDEPSQALTIKEMIDNFKQDDIFGFDEQDLLEFEIRTNQYKVDINKLLNYKSNFVNFFKKRATLIDWMQEVSFGFQFKRETYQVSISIVDRYFEKVPTVPKNKLQLVGATALLIAHKIEEVVCKKNEDFILICNHLYTNKDFNEMEQDICKELSYKLNPPTPYFWMNQLMLQWDGLCEQYSVFENQMIFFKKNNKKSFLLFSQVCQFIDLSYYHVQIYSYCIKQIIAVFMYFTLYQTIEFRDQNDVDCLQELFKRFTTNNLNLSSVDMLKDAYAFAENFQDLSINCQVPVPPCYSNRQDQNGYESYENVCSQQLYNKDFKRIFGISD